MKVRKLTESVEDMNKNMEQFDDQVTAVSPVYSNAEDENDKFVKNVKEVEKELGEKEVTVDAVETPKNPVDNTFTKENKISLEEDYEEDEEDEIEVEEDSDGEKSVKEIFDEMEAEDYAYPSEDLPAIAKALDVEEDELVSIYVEDDFYSPETITEIVPDLKITEDITLYKFKDIPVVCQNINKEYDDTFLHFRNKGDMVAYKEAVDEYKEEIADNEEMLDYEEDLNVDNPDSNISDWKAVDDTAVLTEEDEEEEEEKDLWTKVYDELSSDLDPDDTKRELKPSRGRRYQNIHVDINGNIVVDATSEKKLEYAKQVADHYGVEYKVKKDENPFTEYRKYYPYSLVLIIPCEEEDEEEEEILTEATDISSRPYSDKLWNMVEDGVISTETLANDLISWLSDDEVKEFAEHNGYFTEDEEDEVEEDEEEVEECLNR